jgi:hypothetical protein
VVEGGAKTHGSSRPAAARLEPVESKNVGLTPTVRPEPADPVREPVATTPAAAEGTALGDIEMLATPDVEEQKPSAGDDDSSVLESLLSDVIGGGGAGRANLTVVEEGDDASPDSQRRMGGRGLLSRELTDLNE